ncbi:MAG: SDR family NAD(P)-dependent oxidoreductase [Victivallaceae bacterium]|nr:SDR family NAD(P)-dependent oxidoreductase [Victivallaceae bacterium]
MSLDIIAKLAAYYAAKPEFVPDPHEALAFRDGEFVCAVPADKLSAAISERDWVKLPGTGSLHGVLPDKYTVYLRSALVQGMTYAKNGSAVGAELFPDSLWVECAQREAFVQEVETYKKVHDAMPKTVFFRHGGVMFAAEDGEEITVRSDNLLRVLKTFYADNGLATELTAGEPDPDYIYRRAPELRTLLTEGDTVLAVVSLPPFKIADRALFAESAVSRLRCSEIPADCRARVVAVENKAVFCAAPDYAAALKLAAAVRLEALSVQLSAACGGADYPLAVAAAERSGIKTGRLYGKIAVVTGGAQGFGLGIAEELAAAGAVVAVADLNFAGADRAAQKLCEKFGPGRALALEVNISSEESVAAMYRRLVLKTGGLDLLVANAGVLRAGSVKTLSKKDWDFVTDINYSGYFFCVKYAAQVMAVQNRHGCGWTDIVQINSKSGLVGSNRNGAYAGSKFGTIGLTQSFALELVDDRIKVNSVCPGNFFDGPLWSDPEKGLFVQYLNSSKVPGAKTIADVKRFYEAKIPMNRGCFPADVAKAIIYAVEQQYETGQAIPVTGGQVMLN